MIRTEDFKTIDQSEQFSRASLEVDQRRPAVASPASQFTTESIEREIKSLVHKNRPVIVAKIVLLFLFMLVNFLHSRKFRSTREPVECLRDNGYEWTEPLNKRMIGDSKFRKTLQISSSGLVDFASVSMLVYYNRKGTNIRYPAELLIFYVVRGMVQGNFLFRQPDGGIWPFPGIPSLTVPYGIISDYYFSGHCGFVTLVSLEIWKLGGRVIPIFLGISVLYLGFVLVVARIHYTIDIPIGILFATFCHLMVHRHLRLLEYFARRVFNRCCWLKMRWFAEI